MATAGEKAHNILKEINGYGLWEGRVARTQSWEGDSARANRVVVGHRHD